MSDAVTESTPPRLRMCDETWDIVHQLIRPRALRPCARYMPRSGSRHIHVRVRLALNLVVSGRDARSQHHSANATGLLNSEVPPSLEVTVAVKDGGTPACSVTGMVSEKAARPAASEATLASARKISPSAPPAWRLANTSIVNRELGVPSTCPCTTTSLPRRCTRSIVGGAMPPFGSGWQLGAPSGQILARLSGLTTTPMPRGPT